MQRRIAVWRLTRPEHAAARLGARFLIELACAVLANWASQSTAFEVGGLSAPGRKEVCA